jgi:hypothetical protein
VADARWADDGRLEYSVERQRWCVDPAEDLSPGQADEIDRVYQAYPHLNDDAFVAAGRDAWLT